MNTDLYPRITIVTPNLNGDKYIEKTICSVLSQQYPNLEYIVIDGGSNDKSMDIICKFERYITFFVSEPDRGHAHALNKGFSRATGEVMGWINSDDLLLDRSLWTIADVFTKFSDVDWITSARPSVCDESGCITVLNYEGFSKRFFKRGGYSGQAYSTTWIQQESTFWRRSLWNRAGGQLDEALSLAVDFELWNRFFHFTKPASVVVPLGCFRVHVGQRSTAQYDRYCAEALSCIDGNSSKILLRLARLWCAAKLHKLVAWRRIMSLLYGDRILKLSKTNDGRWHRDLTWTA